MDLCSKVSSKLKEYGIKVFDHHKIENSEEYVYYTEKMIVFVRDDEINIAIQATTRPNEAANLALIMNEIDCEIGVMESFIHDENKNYIEGDEAFDLIEKYNKMKIEDDVRIQAMYTDFLENCEGYEC